MVEEVAVWAAAGAGPVVQHGTYRTGRTESRLDIAHKTDRITSPTLQIPNLRILAHQTQRRTHTDPTAIAGQEIGITG